MIVAASRLCRLVVRTALGLPCDKELLAALEADLFSKVTATSDELEVPPIVQNALLDLHEALSKPAHNIQLLASTCFARMVDVHAVRRSDPVGVVAFVVAQIAESGEVNEEAAQRLALLPWEEASDQVSEDVSHSMNHVHNRALLFSEDLREGLTSAIRDPELATMVARLSGELRSSLNRPSAPITTRPTASR